MLASPVQMSHSSRESGVVPNASFRNSSCTTAIWSTTDSAIAAHSQRFVKRP
jgi:hypothetical protein